MRESSNPTRTIRTDRRKRVQLRIDQDTQRKVKLKADKHDTSINNLYYAMVQYCLASEDFNNVYLEDRFPRDLRQGFYTYHPGKDDSIGTHVYRG